LLSFLYNRGLINIFSRRTTGFHRQAKLFELKFFIRTFPWMIKPGWQNHPHSLPGAQPLMKPLLQ